MRRSNMFRIVIFAAHQRRTEFTLDFLVLVSAEPMTARITFLLEGHVAVWTGVFAQAIVRQLDVGLQKAESCEAGCTVLHGADEVPLAMAGLQMGLQILDLLGTNWTNIHGIQVTAFQVLC